ncbi:SRPBCC family protein [Microbacterium hominis]|uniref:SRPBCC family protein n=1 Tax=Microbacterium hominis TaxID=162426 RepID=UPI001C262BC8|nr:SRPBCC family protein [Microbacterium hominis]
MRARGIYVEARIRADLDAVWDATQDPSQHVRWDVRFSKISPDGMSRAGVSTFTYERRVPFHTVRGSGVSLGEKNGDGTRTSALRFHTDDRLSPIAAGRGYWRYRTDGEEDTVFVTGYDYTPGWPVLDVLVRPILGWATAWSFDRLRIWMETGIPPERWPLLSVLWWWKPDRPRAVRCRRAPQGRPRRADHLADAPPALAALTEPEPTR